MITCLQLRTNARMIRSVYIAKVAIQKRERNRGKRQGKDLKIERGKREKERRERKGRRKKKEREGKSAKEMQRGRGGRL